MLSLIRSVLQFLGLKGDVQDVYPREDQREEVGTNGFVKADLAVVKKDDRIVMAVDYDFGDVPTWVEWDADVNQFSVAQNGGAVAHMASNVSTDNVRRLKDIGRLMFISNVGGAKNAHLIPFVVREKAA